MSPVRLTPLDLTLAATLLIIAAALSLAFRLGLQRTIALSAARMIAQLLLIGVVLKFVFEQTSPWLTAALASVMIIAAGHESASRSNAPGLRRAMFGFGTATLSLVGLLATLFAVVVVIGPNPWYAPAYIVPILGMVLGNALTAISLVFQTMATAVARERGAIEARLALGTARFDALGGPLRDALRTAMTPMLNAMAVAGIVTLPGMMTGQVIAGVDPIEAAKYQIMILCVLSAAVTLAALAAGLAAVTMLTDARHRLRLDRLTRMAH